jgi:hypothetical protein
MNTSNNTKNENNIMGEESTEIKINDNCFPKGYVNIYAFPADEVPDYETYLKLKDREKYLINKGNNTIHQLGLNLIPIVLSGGANTISHCAVGTGSPSTTALGTEVGTRIAVTYKYSINNEFHVDTFYGKNDPNTSSNDLTEAGLFNQLAAGGEMYSSKTISFTKSTSVTMVIAWAWSFV